jgi:3-isopropylmalate dehydrogenase
LILERLDQRLRFRRRAHTFGLDQARHAAICGLRRVARRCEEEAQQVARRFAGSECLFRQAGMELALQAQHQLHAREAIQSEVALKRAIQRYVHFDVRARLARHCRNYGEQAIGIDRGREDCNGGHRRECTLRTLAFIPAGVRPFKREARLKREFDICVLPGDGIGVEVIEASLPVLQKVQQGFTLQLQTQPAGAQHYKRTGEALPDSTFAAAQKADAIFFGAMGWPDIRYPDGTEIAPQLDLRSRLELYAGVRPARALPGIPLPLADPRAKDIDLVVIRESTEGLFASRGKGVVEGDREARDTMVITRRGCERVHEFAFRLAARRNKHTVTCVDKANVFASMAFFRRVFDEVAARHPQITARHHYVDATALDLVRKPWEFDVIVTENMFGDILSDQAAALVGGMGMAPSADIGDRHAVFQPCHGSAPDIHGEGKANPIACILSAAMMLEWLAERSGNGALAVAARRVERAVDEVCASRAAVPYEFGGRAGTRALRDAVLSSL